MLSIFLFLSYLSAMSPEQGGILEFISSSMPENISKGDGVKNLAKKMYKKKFRSENKYSNSTGIKFDFDNFFNTNFELKTGFAFENIKLLLNTSIADGELMYSALDNKVNLKFYKELSKALELGISNERAVETNIDTFLFNLYYKF